VRAGVRAAAVAANLLSLPRGLYDPPPVVLGLIACGVDWWWADRGKSKPSIESAAAAAKGRGAPAAAPARSQIDRSQLAQISRKQEGISDPATRLRAAVDRRPEAVALGGAAGEGLAAKLAAMEAAAMQQ
jgi:hypothetical protein